MKFKNAKLVQVSLLLGLVIPAFAFALPEGENVVAGSATFDLSQANTLSINTSSDRLIVNYNSFNIAQPEAVFFHQPSASSIVLNRVVGVDPSSIMGTLSANGRVFIVNPNGVLFGPNSHVDVAGLVASSLNISNDDFLNGNYVFSKSGKNSYVINQGTITAKSGGYVCLLGGAVDNRLAIQADLGTVVLASGEKITLALEDQNEISVVVDEAVQSEVFGPDGNKITSAIKNSGSILAEGGKVNLTVKVLNKVFDMAINNTGLVKVTSLVKHDGIIELMAEGAPIVNSGSLEADKITVLADASFTNSGEIKAPEVYIKVNNAGITNAPAGKIIAEVSSTALIGGNIFLEAASILQQGFISANVEQGTAGEIRVISENNTILDENSRTEARATSIAGNGGRITIGSKQDSVFVNKNAKIDFSAGTVSGNGGTLWVDAFQQLGFYGILDGRAPPGFQPGKAFLDPLYSEISGVFSADTVIYSPNNISIIGDISFSSNLTILADHNSETPGDWNDGIGAIINTGEYTISGTGAESELLLMASSGIGSSDFRILTSVNNLVVVNRSTNGIYISNNKSLVILAAVNTGTNAPIDIVASGDISVRYGIIGNGGVNLTAQGGSIFLSTIANISAPGATVSLSAAAGISRTNMEVEEANGLLAYWNFDDNYGSYAYDVSGEYQYAYINGNPVWQAEQGKFGAGYSFDGIDDYMSVAGNFNLGGGSFTLIVYYQGTQSTNNLGIVGASPGSSGYALESQYGLLQSWVNENMDKGTHLINDGLWHQLVMVRNGGQGSLYIDGVPELVNFDTSSGTVDTTANFWIGGWGHMKRLTQGSLDDVRVYGRALSGLEIYSQTLIAPGAGEISAGSLILSAATGIASGDIPLETAVSYLEAETESGDININNTGILDFQASASLGNIYIINTGDLNIVNSGVYAGQNININAFSNFTVDADVTSASGTGEIYLAADGDINLNANLSADSITVLADADLSGTGDLYSEGVEGGPIYLGCSNLILSGAGEGGFVITGNTIYRDEAFTAELNPPFEVLENLKIVSSIGDIIVEWVQVAETLSLIAGGSIIGQLTEGPNIIAPELYLVAGVDIGTNGYPLYTDIDQFSAYAEGSIYLDNIDSLIVEEAVAYSGSVNISANRFGGYSYNGDIYVGYISAPSSVSLEANYGSIIGQGDYTNIETYNLYLYATDSIYGNAEPYSYFGYETGFLATDVNYIEAEALGWGELGEINIYNLGSAELGYVRAGGEYSIHIIADGNIYADYLYDPYHITLEARDGSIIGQGEGTVINTQNAYLYARDSIYGYHLPETHFVYNSNYGFVTTNADYIEAYAGNLAHIYSTADELELGDVSGSGSLHVLAYGDILVDYISGFASAALESWNGSIIGQYVDETADINSNSLSLYASLSIYGNYSMGDERGRLVTQITNLDAQAGNEIRLYDVGTLVWVPGEGEEEYILVPQPVTVTNATLSNSGGTIDIAATYDLQLGYVNAPIDYSSYVHLTSLEGAIVGLEGNQVIAGDIYLTANNGIGDVDGIPINTLATTFDSVIATNYNSGSIYIADSNTYEIYFTITNYASGGDIIVEVLGGLYIEDGVVTSGSGTIILTADDFIIYGPVATDTGNITLLNASPDRQIAIGYNTEDDALKIDEDEIAQIVTAGLITIGSDTTGTIIVGTAEFAERNIALITGDTIEILGTLSTTTGDIFITADDYTIGGETIASETGNITLANASADREIALGYNTEDDALKIDEDEIAQIVTTGLITIGSDTTGTIIVGTAEFADRNIALITGDTIKILDILSTTTGDIFITADDYTIGGETIASETGNITLANASADREIALGYNSAEFDDMEIDDDELPNIVTQGLLTIGSSTAGDITLETADFSNVGGVHLITGGSIIGQGEGTVINTQNAYLYARDSIYGTSTPDSHYGYDNSFFNAAGVDYIEAIANDSINLFIDGSERLGVVDSYDGHVHIISDANINAENISAPYGSVTLEALNGSIIGQNTGYVDIDAVNLSLYAADSIYGNYYLDEEGTGRLVTQITNLDAQAGNEIRLYDVGTLVWVPGEGEEEYILVPQPVTVTNATLSNSGGTIDIAATYDLQLGYVNAPIDYSSYVHLTSLEGAIVGLEGNQVIAGDIYLTANNGIGDVDGIPINTLATTFDSVIATNYNSGSIYIADSNTYEIYFTITNYALLGAVRLSSQAGGVYLLGGVSANGGDIIVEVLGGLYIPPDGVVTSGSGNIILTADDFIIYGPVATDTGNITLLNASPDRQIALGYNSAEFDDMEIDDDELPNIVTQGLLTIGSSTAGAITLETADFSNVGGVHLITGGSIIGLGLVPEESDFVAKGNSILEAGGVIHFALEAPLNILITEGDLGVIINSEIGGISAVLAGSTPSGTIKVNNEPPGEVYFNATPIWSPPIWSPPAAAPVGNIMSYKPITFDAAELAMFQFNSLIGTVFFYHFLTEIDMAAFDQLSLGADAYQLRDGELQLIGHDNLQQFFEEFDQKKKQQVTY